MSRKTILTVTAIVGAILGVLVSTLGLSINATALATGLAGILYWVFKESKADLKNLSDQSTKWRDPKFWLTVITAVVTALATSGVNLPVSPEIIIAVLTAIVGILFKVKATATA
jgi:O-antigen/teichoic acid export membrane protein